MSTPKTPDGNPDILAIHNAAVQRMEDELLGRIPAADPGQGQPSTLLADGDTEREEEQDEADRLADVRQRDMESSSTERRILLLEEKLAEQAVTIQRLSRDKGFTDIDDVARDAMEAAEYARWRPYYDLIKRRGGICTITINPVNEGEPNQPVPVGHNGKWYFLPRGVPIKVSAEVLEVLVNAVRISREPLVDANGDRHWTIVKKRTYPFMVMDPPAAHANLGM